MGQDSYLPLEKSGQSVIDQNLPYRFLRGQPLKKQGKKLQGKFKILIGYACVSGSYRCYRRACWSNTQKS